MRFPQENQEMAIFANLLFPHALIIILVHKRVLDSSFILDDQWVIM
jgi:hypothetical protein